MGENTLYYGDNLAVMREHIADESVDLIYLDPPFNSSRDYNVLFKQAARDENQAQITAFEDTWKWSKRHYEEFFDEPKNARLFELMASLRTILGTSPMMAYVVMMAPRLLELHRVLKPTGSLYLHCDPVASHYLKILLDVVFGPQRFVNEIIWKRTSAHSDVGQGARHMGRIHDTILAYRKSVDATWNVVHTPYSEDYVGAFYRYEEPDTGRLYRLGDLTAAKPGGDVSYEWRIKRPEGSESWEADLTDEYLSPREGYEYAGVRPYKGRFWAYSRANMTAMAKQGRIEYSAPGMPQYKRYLDEMPGCPLQDIWTEIKPAQADERTGYPTQKPLALLERIISASSNEGDLVLDPFCGCGTAVVAAEKLRRKWIGIDVTYIALDLMISRLAKDFDLKRGKDYKVIGDPKDAYSARKLFQQSPKQFEIWAVGLVMGVPQPDKSGDRGIDGKVYFSDLKGNLQFAVCQVKGGHLTPTLIRDFSHVIQREKAAMGYFICLDTPTKGMYNEADEIGFFETPSGRKIPKLQIRTIKELVEEKKEFDFPKGYTLKSGSGGRLTRAGTQGEMAFGEGEE